MKKRNVVKGQKIVNKLTGEKLTIRGVGYTDDYVLVKGHPSALLRENLKLAHKNNLVCEQCGSMGATWGFCPYIEEVDSREVDACLCRICYNGRAMDI